MKSYTDIEKSKKLAEILPNESADMWWAERYEAYTTADWENGYILLFGELLLYYKHYNKGLTMKTPDKIYVGTIDGKKFSIVGEGYPYAREYVTADMVDEAKDKAMRDIAWKVHCMISEGKSIVEIDHYVCGILDF